MRQHPRQETSYIFRQTKAIYRPRSKAPGGHWTLFEAEAHIRAGDRPYNHESQDEIPCVPLLYPSMLMGLGNADDWLSRSYNSARSVEGDLESHG